MSDIIAIKEAVEKLAVARQVTVIAKSTEKQALEALKPLPEYTTHELARAARLQTDKAEAAAREALEAAVVPAYAGGHVSKRPHPAVTVVDGPPAISLTDDSDWGTMVAWCMVYLPDAITIDFKAVGKEVEKMSGMAVEPEALKILRQDVKASIAPSFSLRVASDLTQWLPAEPVAEEIEPIQDADLPF